MSAPSASGLLVLCELLRVTDVGTLTFLPFYNYIIAAHWDARETCNTGSGKDHPSPQAFSLGRLSARSLGKSGREFSASISR